MGQAETYTTASKTIHNYVVNIKIDNLQTPYIRVATGNDESKAMQIVSSMEYLMKHRKTEAPSARRSVVKRKCR